MKLSPMLVGLVVLVMSGKKKQPQPPSLQVPGSASPLVVPKNGPHLTIEELRTLAQQVGFPDPNLAAAFAMAESSGFASALGDNGNSVGLWQVNMPSHRKYDPQKLFEPTYNAQAAFEISKGGTDWEHGWWTTFHSGAYKRYMPAPVAGAAVAQLIEAVEAVPSTSTSERETEPAEVQSEPAPLEVEVLDQVEGLDQVADGVDARVRVSDAAPRTGRARRGRRG